MRSTVTVLGVAALAVVASCTGGEPGAVSSSYSVTTASPSTSAVTTTTAKPEAPTTELPAPTQPAVVDTQNLGLAALWVCPLADGVAVGVATSNQERDLENGDRSDVVVHVITNDQVLDTGLHAPWGVTPLPDGGFVVEVYEHDTGVDLNEDEDTEDMVPHLWTVEEGVRNLGVAGIAYPSSDGKLWVHVYEAGERRDLNGDGDVGYESVVHSWDAAGGWSNTSWAAGSVTPLADGTVILGVFEEAQGNSDFNGDGATDGHLAVWLGPDTHQVIGSMYTARALDDGGALISSQDTSAGGSSRTWTLTIWHPGQEPVVLDLPTVNHRPIPGGGAYFRVAESPDYWNYQTACDLGQDLNGDGDCEDFVLHLWTPQEGLESLGLADWWCPECDWGYVVVGGSAFVSAPQDPGSGESANGEEEHSVLHLVINGRVTPLDVIPTTATRSWAVLETGVILTAGPNDVFTLVDLSGAATGLGLAGYVAYPMTGGAILLGDEGLSGLDLNGDGTVAEGTQVVHTWQPGFGVLNLGLTIARSTSDLEGTRPLPPVELPGTDRLVVLVSELEHGSRDLNGDGDVNDAIVHIVSRTPGTK